MCHVKIIFYIFISLPFSIRSDINYSNYTNETDYLRYNDSVSTEMFICDNISTTCLPLSEELTTEQSQFISEATTSAITKRTTVVENITLAPTTKAPVIKKELKSIPEKNCQCDLTPIICDINCCCDTDCNRWEQEAFSKCIRHSLVVNYGQCVTTDIIYKNNTPYPTTRSIGGLMCISKDNFPERNAFIDLEVIKSIPTFERIWKRKIHYYWIFQEQKLPLKLQKSELYKYDDPVWKFINSTGEAATLELPGSTTSSMCHRQQMISYLNEFKSSCSLIAPRTNDECTEIKYFNARYYCQDFILISSPSLINSSHLMDSSDEAFVKAKQYLCENSYCNETDTYPEPYFDAESKSCKNVVKSVNIILRHSGRLGIKQAECRIALHFSDHKQMLFKQSFEVSYLPAHLANASVIFKRSGTPGYREGMPVLTKMLVDNQHIIPTPLTVVGGMHCDSYVPVLFKENVRIQCTYHFHRNATLNCSHLEEQVINKMLKGVGEVGITGDPEDWLEPPTTLISAPTLGSTCSPVTSLALDFVYSYRGSLQNPEAKIIGIMSRFDNHHVPDCSSLSCSLSLITVVSFTDVSRQVISKYASAPVVKIKLPKDFFYPFSSSSMPVFVCSKHLITLKCVVILFLYNIL